MATTYKLTLDTLLDAARTTVAAVVSMLLARLLKLPEFYWAPISAIVIIQSTIDPRTLEWQRFAGTALGAVVGALIATRFHTSALVYAVAIFLCGVLCAFLRFRGAYRFAGDHHSIDRAHASGVDRRFASLCGSIGGDCGGARLIRGVAQSRVTHLSISS
jgi:hypothetical protein